MEMKVLKWEILAYMLSIIDIPIIDLPFVKV